MRPARDTVGVCVEPLAAAAIRSKGYFSVQIGSEGCPDAEYLRQNWGRITCRNPSAVVFGNQELAELVKELCYQTQVNNNTGSKRSRRWVEHMLRNVRRLTTAPSALGLANKLQGMPCFIVGAGPSLSKNAAYMHWARQKGVVIAVNSASRVVDATAVLTVESNPIMAKLHAYDAARIYTITSDPQTLDDGNGPFLPIWTGEIGWVCDKLTGLQRVAVSGSGTTAAVSLAHLWGCSPIVLVGQDLAYTDGKVYAPETGFSATISPEGQFNWDVRSLAMPRPGNPLPEDEEMIRVFGWGGGEVMSGPTFLNVLRWLASAAEHCNADHLVTINATEGGAAIPGWKPMRLEDVVNCLDDREVTPLQLADMAGAPCVTPARLDEWLAKEATTDLLEPWAMPAVRELLDGFRERHPLQPPMLEAVARWQFDRKLESIVRRSQRELRGLIDSC